MDLQDAKWRKPMVLGGVILLLLGSAGAYYAGGAEEPPLVLQQEPVQEQAQAATEVRGLQQANAGKELRNPFSLLHEREGEEAAAVPEHPQTDKGSMPPPADGNPVRARPRNEARKSVPVPKSSAPGIVLCGIVEGDGGRLALLQAGGVTAAAAAGETVNGWQVTGIGTAAVTVQRAGQVLSLPLAAGNTGVK